MGPLKSCSVTQCRSSQHHMTTWNLTLPARPLVNTKPEMVWVQFNTNTRHTSFGNVFHNRSVDRLILLASFKFKPCSHVSVYCSLLHNLKHLHTGLPDDSELHTYECIQAVTCLSVPALWWAADLSQDEPNLSYSWLPGQDPASWHRIGYRTDLSLP